jgi:hypothetical protein
MRHARGFIVAPIVGLAAGVANAGLTINASYETSWTNNAPAAAQADLNAVIAQLQNTWTNNVTVNIQFGWGTLATYPGHPGGFPLPGGGAAAWFPQLDNAQPDQYTLAQTKTLYNNHATAHPENTNFVTAKNNLPLAYPNPNGRASFFVSDAQYKALTGVAQNADTVDAFVGIGAGGNWAFGAAAGGAGTAFFRGALEHEITHAMGRFDNAYNSALGGGPSFLTPLDFFKYVPGNTTLDPTRSVTAFSIDGGTTQPAGFQFNASSDSSDWNNSANDSFNFTVNNFQSMSATDLVEMNALGWDPIPAPSTLALLGLGGFVAARRRR